MRDTIQAWMTALTADVVVTAIVYRSNWALSRGRRTSHTAVLFAGVIVSQAGLAWLTARPPGRCSFGAVNVQAGRLLVRR